MTSFQRLRGIVRESGIKQRVLARDVGLTESAFSTLLAGKRPKASAELLNAVLAALRRRTGRTEGLTLNDLFVEEPGASPERAPRRAAA